MTITRHPDALTLMSHAAGSLAEPFGAVVAAHLALCGRCRAEVRDLERVGMALLAAGDSELGRELGGDRTGWGEAGVAADRGRGVLAAPRAPLPAAPIGGERGPVPGRADDPLPLPIRRRWNIALADVRWHKLARGIWHHRLALPPGAAGALHLIRVEPRVAIPDHGHAGAELTLVLQGGFEDATGHYLPGDVEDVDAGLVHRPRADAEGCISLVASEGPVRLTGLGPRLLQAWRRRP